MTIPKSQKMEIESNDFQDIWDEEEAGSCKDKCDEDYVANYELDKNESDKDKTSKEGGASNFLQTDKPKTKWACFCCGDEKC